MRFTVDVTLGSESIGKDKNRMVMSLFKHCLSKSDVEYYRKIYETGEPNQKDMTFSIFMPECRFLRDTIVIPSKTMRIHVSLYDLQMGIQFYSSMMAQVGEEYRYHDISLTINKVTLQKEKVISSKKVVFKTTSPCVAREHNDDNKSNWFHSLSTEKGKEMFLHNIKVQALENFPDKQSDIGEISIRVLKNKEVKVKHYGVVVLANLAVFEMQAETYLLDYFYKSGVSSMKSSGFGMLEIL